MTSTDTGALLERVRALEAEQDFRSIVRELQACDRRDLLAEPGLGLTLAVALRVLGDPDAALALVRELDEPARRRGSERLNRRLLNLRAALRFERGDVAAAQELWEALLERSAREDDPGAAARASNNLGVVHTLQGRPDQALAAYGRARAACQRLGDRRGLAQAAQNLAITYRETGFHDHAHAHFAEAADHARASGSEDVLGRVEEERALLLLMEGDPALAERHARRALDRLARLADRAGQGEALRVLGLVALVQGRFDDATERLTLALDHARAAGAALLEAETLAALAAVRRRQGRHGEADEPDAEAAESFRRLNAEAWGERIRQRIQQLLPAEPH